MKSRQRKEGKIGDEREKAATVDGVGRRRRCGWEVMPVMEPLVAESALVTLMSVCNDARGKQPDQQPSVNFQNVPALVDFGTFVPLFDSLSL